MEPQPIQDVAPPPPEPEIVADIPVRAPAGHASDEQKPLEDSSFIVPATPLPAAINKDKEKLQTKAAKPKPTLAIVVALLAIISLATGAYLKFFSNR